MGESVAEIELPDGDPGAVRDAARGLGAISAAFESGGATAQRALGLVGGWTGFASMGFRDSCASYSEAGEAAREACRDAAVAVGRYGDRLTDARERVRKLQAEAEDCLERLKAAQRRESDAAEREQSARTRAQDAALRSPLDGGLSLGEHAGALNDAEAAAGDRIRAGRAVAAEREEHERLKGLAKDEREDVKEAGQEAARAVTGAEGRLPEVTYPPPPAQPDTKPADGGGLLNTLGELSGINDAGRAIKDIGDGDILGALGHAAMAAPTPFGKAAKGGKLAKEGLEQATKQSAKHSDDAAGAAGRGASAAPDGSGTVVKLPDGSIIRRGADGRMRRTDADGNVLPSPRDEAKDITYKGEQLRREDELMERQQSTEPARSQRPVPVTKREKAVEIGRLLLDGAAELRKLKDLDQ